MRRSHSTAPVTLEVEFALTQHADNAELVPGSERRDGRTLPYTHADYREVFRAFRAMYNLAAVRLTSGSGSPPDRAPGRCGARFSSLGMSLMTMYGWSGVKRQVALVIGFRRIEHGERAPPR